MKKELSWIPLASGSDAIRGRVDDTRHASGQTDAIMRRNVDRERECGNCTSFILVVNLMHITEALARPDSQRDRLQIAKRAIEDAATMDTLMGDAGRVLPV